MATCCQHLPRASAYASPRCSCCNTVVRAWSASAPSNTDFDATNARAAAARTGQSLSSIAPSRCDGRLFDMAMRALTPTELTDAILMMF